MEDDVRLSEGHPPRWAESLLRLFLDHDEAETESGDLLEAYRDSIRPQRGRIRADMWFVLQVGGYILRAKAVTLRRCMIGGGIVLLWLVAVLFGGGITLLATVFGSAVTLISIPVLLFSGRLTRAIKLFTIWAAYLSFYLIASTGMALFPYYFQSPPHLALGQEVCADSGCFAVDRVEKGKAGSEITYTLFWHLASNDRQQTKHFPGRGLEIYVFDERGRTFQLPASANQNPLDVILPAGQTVHQSMTFNIPSDARELFLMAKYRAFTFQSLLPGEISLVRLPHAKLIQIQ